jgi:hypothetical protein
LRAARWASVPPIFPAPMSAIFLRAITAQSFLDVAELALRLGVLVQRRNHQEAIIFANSSQ